MYLTAGQYKGCKIDVPNDVKPTLSKVRESVFNILAQYDFKDDKFLDMFAGSSIMGLEALSRGYKVKELEISPKSAKIIKKNYEKLKLSPDLTVCNCLKYKTDEKYDVIYADPPWDMDYVPVVLKAYELIDDNGVIVLEYDKLKNIDLKEILDFVDNKLEIVKEKQYGRCLLAVLKKV